MKWLSRTSMEATDAARSVDGALRSAVGRFKRDEEGSLLIFGLFAFVMMLLLAGVSLDLMRFEERRTRLQATIDRAAARRRRPSADAGAEGCGQGLLPQGGAARAGR